MDCHVISFIMFIHAQYNNDNYNLRRDKLINKSKWAIKCVDAFLQSVSTSIHVIDLAYNIQEKLFAKIFLLYF